MSSLGVWRNLALSGLARIPMVNLSPTGHLSLYCKFTGKQNESIFIMNKRLNNVWHRRKKTHYKSIERGKPEGCMPLPPPLSLCVCVCLICSKTINSSFYPHFVLTVCLDCTRKSSIWYTICYPAMTPTHVTLTHR